MKTKNKTHLLLVYSELKDVNYEVVYIVSCVYIVILRKRIARYKLRIARKNVWIMKEKFGIIIVIFLFFLFCAETGFHIFQSETKYSVRKKKKLSGTWFYPSGIDLFHNRMVVRGERLKVRGVCEVIREGKSDAMQVIILNICFSEEWRAQMNRS